MLVRMDTTNPGTIQYFPVPHETNVSVAHPPDLYKPMWSDAHAVVASTHPSYGRLGNERATESDYASLILQALAFDNSGNMWVSGASSLSLVNIDPNVIGATWAPDSVGTTTLLTPGGTPIDLIAAQVGDAGTLVFESNSG